MDFVYLQREQSLCTRKTVSGPCLHVLPLKCMAAHPLQEFPALSNGNSYMYTPTFQSNDRKKRQPLFTLRMTGGHSSLSLWIQPM